MREMITLRKLRVLASTLVLLVVSSHVGEALVPVTLPISPQAWGTQKSRELICLAKNIYFESRGEPFHGKIAVAQVTLNRVNHKTEFHSTICGVVYANKQFSWTANKLSIRDSQAWAESLKIAQAVLHGSLRLSNFDALYFHTKQVKPYWRKTKTVVRVIGNHIFYA